MKKQMKIYTVIFCVLLTAQSFGELVDPCINDQIGYSNLNEIIEKAPLRSNSNRDLIPPEFTISHTENGDVTIQVTSDEDLFTGWVDDKLVWSVTNFDYWWLNSRIAKDAQNNIYVAVKLFEYSNPNYNYDMYELQNNGEILEDNQNWNGPGDNPLIVNNPDENVFLGKPTMDSEGVVDSDNITYIVSNNGGTGVLITKIDADGTILMNCVNVISGANAWANEIRMAIDTNHRIYIVWSADLQDIQYAYSDDGGESWSVPVSLCYTASHQVNKPQICCDSNGNVHLVWMHYTGSAHRLAYMKLRPDGTIAIDESFLTNSSAWMPQMDIDEENNLHIVWGSNYTKINGNLDGDGLSMTDDELSIVQEYQFIYNPHAYASKCVIDEYQNAHAIYMWGEGSCNTPKSLYYKKMNSVPLLKIECPNDSILFVKMTGDGVNWEGTFTPPEFGIYDVRVSASDIDGNTGVDNYQFEYIESEIDENELLISNVHLSNYPNPFNPTTTISFSVTQTSSFVNLEIFNLKGQKIKQLVSSQLSAGQHSVVWDSRDENGNNVSSGIYFYKIKSEKISETRKMILIK